MAKKEVKPAIGRNTKPVPITGALGEDGFFVPDQQESILGMSPERFAIAADVLSQLFWPQVPTAGVPTQMAQGRIAGREREKITTQGEALREQYRKALLAPKDVSLADRLGMLDTGQQPAPAPTPDLGLLPASQQAALGRERGAVGNLRMQLLQSLLGEPTRQAQEAITLEKAKQEPFRTEAAELIPKEAMQRLVLGGQREIKGRAEIEEIPTRRKMLENELRRELLKKEFEEATLTPRMDEVISRANIAAYRERQAKAAADPEMLELQRRQEELRTSKLEQDLDKLKYLNSAEYRSIIEKSKKGVKGRGAAKQSTISANKQIELDLLVNTLEEGITKGVIRDSKTKKQRLPNMADINTYNQLARNKSAGYLIIEDQPFKVDLLNGLTLEGVRGIIKSSEGVDEVTEFQLNEALKYLIENNLAVQAEDPVAFEKTLSQSIFGL